MFDGLHFGPLAGWQSGYAAVCNTVYAGSIPTPASINSFLQIVLFTNNQNPQLGRTENRLTISRN